MDELVAAIRKRAAQKGLKPWTLAKDSDLSLSQWQTLLQKDSIGNMSHRLVMSAAKQLGLKPRV